MDASAQLNDFLRAALPGRVARRLPSAELLADWRELAGELIAQRARPVCWDDQGRLVVAVAGSAWRQELSLQGPMLVDDLRQRGHRVAGLKLVGARSVPPPPAPEPEPDPLTPDQEARLAAMVAGVEDPALREAVLNALRAAAQAPPGPDR